MKFFKTLITNYRLLITLLLVILFVPLLTHAQVSIDFPTDFGPPEATWLELFLSYMQPVIYIYVPVFFAATLSYEWFVLRKSQSWRVMLSNAFLRTLFAALLFSVPLLLWARFGFHGYTL
jgi:hypothetical protein